jgi:sterol 14-demethylase
MASPVDQPAFGGHLLGLPTTTAGWALYLVMFSAMALAGWQLVFARPPAPRNAPALWAAYDWPAVGSALTFYKRPRDMVLEGIRASKHGSFSFYVGKKHVVAVGGPAGRRVFFESRALSHLHG